MAPGRPRPPIADIERLLAAFRPERLVHIAITIASVAVLLGCAGFLLLKGEIEWAIGLFGSTGAITYSTGRLLRMWRDVIGLLYDSKVGGA